MKSWKTVKCVVCKKNYKKNPAHMESARSCKECGRKAVSNII